MLNILMTVTDSVAERPIGDRLIINIANGDKVALQELYELASDSVYGFALSITKNLHDAQDVLQETFLSIYTTAPNYVPAGKPMAWILTIAKNKALSKQRERARTVELDDNAGHCNERFLLEKNIENKILIETLMTKLKSDERQIIMLHAVSGLKHREIASLLTLPVGTVLAKYNRAVAKLRKFMKGEI